jgi:hypothetical protein
MYLGLIKTKKIHDQDKREVQQALHKKETKKTPTKEQGIHADSEQGIHVNLEIYIH